MYRKLKSRLNTSSHLKSLAFVHLFMRTPLRYLVASNLADKIFKFKQYLDVILELNMNFINWLTLFTLQITGVPLNKNKNLRYM